MTADFHYQLQTYAEVLGQSFTLDHGTDEEETTLNIKTFPEAFSKVVRTHARRLPVDLQEDFLSLVGLECIETLNHSVTFEELRRVADRVRHRLIRDLRRRQVKSLKDDDGIETIGQPEARAIQLPLSEMLASLPVNLAFIVQQIIEGHTSQEIADMLGITRRTVSRQICEIRELFRRRQSRDER